MEKRTTEIASTKSAQIKIGVIPGHFATNHSHLNYYVDLEGLKYQYKTAQETARVISAKYMNASIDTIICLEGTHALGAYIAEHLSEGGSHSVNSDKDICVITPEVNSNGQMIFRDNTQNKIYGKDIMLLISLVSTGITVQRCIECLNYYSGNLTAVASIFSAIEEINGVKIDSVFSIEDIPDYSMSSPEDCPMCGAGKKVDAIVNAHGYSKIG